MQKAIDNTAGFTLRQIKTKISARSGNLRKSYLVRRRGKLKSLVFSGRLGTGAVRYADAVEFGYSAHTIQARRTKFLIIPLSDDVLTPSKAHIRKLGDEEFKQAVKDGKIIVRKRVRVGPFGGTHIISRKVKPRVQRRLNQEITVAIRRAIK